MSKKIVSRLDVIVTDDSGIHSDTLHYSVTEGRNLAYSLIAATRMWDYPSTVACEMKYASDRAAELFCKIV